MRYQYYLFDLDGTLTDSGRGITNSVKYALAKYNIMNPEMDTLLKFVGPPLADSFQKYYGLSVCESKQAIQYYREYYTAGGMFENEVYEGIPELLKRLKEAGKTLIVATSKPEDYAKQILEHFDLARYFDCIAGASMDETRVNKDEVIAYALSQCELPEKSQIVMIGDREHDVLGAKKNGLASIGVLFGFGDREELEAAGADYIVETPEEIAAI